MKPVTLTHGQLLVLAIQCTQTMQSIEDDGSDHLALLIEHLADFIAEFAHKYGAQRKQYRIKFTSLQALAFKQIFEGYAMPPEAAVIVNALLAEIDKARKQKLILQP